MLFCACTIIFIKALKRTQFSADISATVHRLWLCNTSMQYIYSSLRDWG